ncbi:MAG: hypothetical protein Q8P35_02240 [Candidatus Yanofskybacteria bacterium]|nr:hypothetical protein [Candidatus Yanofskybacteria bacterium]
MRLERFLKLVKELGSSGNKFKTPFTQPIVLALFALAIGTSGMAYYFYGQYNSITGNPNIEARSELDVLLGEVSKLIVLPINEVPTVATVTDPERLRGEIFFANAKVGDKVLIYTSARKAILYDPVNKKIIEVAPLNIGDSP